MPSSKRYFLFLSLFAVLVAVAALFFKKPVQNIAHDILQMKTAKSEHTGRLKFTNGTPVSNKMANAILCADHFDNIHSIDLYMPAMGHGSEPPLVKKYTENIPVDLQGKAPQDKDFGCLAIEKMQLFMPGLWQVRAFYTDGSIGIIDVNLRN